MLQEPRASGLAARFPNLGVRASGTGLLDFLAGLLKH